MGSHELVYIYLVKFAWSYWFNVATRHVNLSSIVIEIDACHAIQNGPHYASFTSILTFLKTATYKIK